ncbi:MULTISPECIES: ABC transporter substrate-binding protein [Sporomusa]|uniref:ABC transporter substrate-binding protein n=1 Tax=Sporomusa TaxID=2375 RepID=UPI002CF13085|nr:ABC transporter substrate-binding protein [Sporomusa sphaeroides]HML32952.1 ABC transporter substrate-binding protein [Sporomusa sphaeroides]
MKKKLFAALCMMVISLVALAGCGGKTGEKNANAGMSGKDSVIIAMDTESEPAAGFDPIMGWAAGEHTHDPLFQSTLLITKDDITIGYDLAKEYTISPDGLTWTFKIRPDVKFTDGKPLTAKDVAFTYNQAMKQATDTDLSMLKSVEAVDDTTAVFHLNTPYSAFAYIAAVVGIVPEHAYNAATYGKNPIGSGRYILKQWDKGQQVILEANPNYYGEKAKMKQVTIVFMSEAAAYAAAKGGQVDVAYTAPSYTVNPINGYKILAFDSVDIRGINLPCVPAGNKIAARKNGETLPAGNDVTANLAIRQAIARAVDREALVKNVLYGYGSVAYSDSVDEPWENEAMKTTYDPAKAKSILEADGWRLNADGIYEKQGLKAEFDLLYIASNSARTGIAMAVKEMLKEVGIKVNPVGSSWDKIATMAYETPHVFGAGLHSPAGIKSHYYTGKNYASYSNSAVDKHIEAALAATSVEDSYQYWKKAQWDGVSGVTPAADSPWVWLAEIKHIYFAKENLNVIDKKIHPHGYGWTIANNVDQWYWN